MWRGKTAKEQQMVRKYDIEEADRGRSFTYWLAVVLIVMAWVGAFKLYFSSYENQHPDIAWASPGMNRQTETADGVYLWEETVFKAPAAGKVYYPQGVGPVRVSSGQAVAKIVTESGAEKYIRAFQQGYFIAGTDGQENNWRYSLIWTELKDALPKTQPVTMHANGDTVAQNAPIGKLIPQPQTLRIIGLAKADSAVAKQLNDKKLKLMMDAEDTPTAAEVSISVKTGDKVKFLVLLPWFDLNAVSDRSGKITIESGHAEGAFVPRSAVIERHGKQGVYLVRGTRVVFRAVKGENVAGNKFLVTEGISAGDAVVEDAENSKEGRIQIW